MDGEPLCIQKPGQLQNTLTQTDITISSRSSTKSTKVPSINCPGINSPGHQKSHPTNRTLGKTHPPGGITDPIGAHCGMTTLLVAKTIEITHAIDISRLIQESLNRITRWTRCGLLTSPAEHERGTRSRKTSTIERTHLAGILTVGSQQRTENGQPPSSAPPTTIAGTHRIPSPHGRMVDITLGTPTHGLRIGSPMRTTINLRIHTAQIGAQAIKNGASVIIMTMDGGERRSTRLHRH